MKISLSEIRSMARADLAGKWSNAVLLIFVYMLFTIPLCLPADGLLGGIFYAVLFFAFLQPLWWGVATAFLNNIRRSDSPFSLNRMFDCFKDYVRITETTSLMLIYVILWALLSSVPYSMFLKCVDHILAKASFTTDELYVIYWLLYLPLQGMVLNKTLSYYLTPYILKDNPELKNNGAIELSMKMMDGHKMDLFLLSLSFIGWGLLCILTLGIGLLWLIPYIQASTARFYEHVKAEYEQKNVG